MGTGDIVCGNDLQTAILISLFTDRLADASDETDDGNRRGWWGDLEQDYRVGSRLWLLRRQKLTTQVALKAEAYAREALQWLKDDGV
ncbi:phage GP46 family protein, partial [Escherichia coli]|nr:phage GP46 family protein [Escherichia coli]